jgi:hypothetical protein
MLLAVDANKVLEIRRGGADLQFAGNARDGEKNCNRRQYETQLRDATHGTAPWPGINKRRHIIAIAGTPTATEAV